MSNFQQLPIEVLDSRIWPLADYTLSRLRMKAAEHLASLLPTESNFTPDTLFKMLERARNEEHGLFALPCPQLRLPGSPVAVAQDLAARFPCDNVFVTAVAAGPFLNISVDGAFLLKEAVTETLSKGESYGTNSIGEGKRICIDYSSPNIAKPFHVGHLRSTIIGNFLKLVYRANGFNVHGINYLGDWGKQYGLLAVGFARYGSEEALQTDPIRHLFDVYVKINADVKDDAKIDDEARAYFRKMEEGDEEALKLWSRFRELSIEKYKQIYKRLNVEFEEYSGESCFEHGMMDRVDELEKMGLLVDSQGAKVVDLDPYKLGKAIIIKKDGATLYLTRDIAAANERFERLKLDKAIYVVASQQDLHLQQLFKIMELSGRPWAKNMVHINFGMVLGMSTRKGKVEFLEDVLNDAKNTMHEVMKDNPAKYAEIADPEATSDNLAISAIVVQDMAAKRVKDYKWELERVTKFEGDTGPYLQYAHSRLRSIERKASDVVGSDLSKADLTLLTEKEAVSLALLIARYPDVVQEARITTEPCTVINYLMLLSRSISTALDRLWVMNQEADLALARVTLYTAARITLGNGLRLIGLKPLDRM
jgi:arginyl-tRNA synthetase